MKSIRFSQTYSEASSGIFIVDADPETLQGAHLVAVSVHEDTHLVNDGATYRLEQLQSSNANCLFIPPITEEIELTAQFSSYLTLRRVAPDFSRVYRALAASRFPQRVAGLPVPPPKYHTFDSLRLLCAAADEELRAYLDSLRCVFVDNYVVWPTYALSGELAEDLSVEVTGFDQEVGVSDLVDSLVLRTNLRSRLEESLVPGCERAEALDACVKTVLASFVRSHCGMSIFSEEDRGTLSPLSMAVSFGLSELTQRQVSLTAAKLVRQASHNFGLELSLGENDLTGSGHFYTDEKGSLLPIEPSSLAWDIRGRLKDLFSLKIAWTTSGLTPLLVHVVPEGEGTLEHRTVDLLNFYARNKQLTGDPIWVTKYPVT